jgi:HD-like signal output (HDOD) protein
VILPGVAPSPQLPVFLEGLQRVTLAANVDVAEIVRLLRDE